jgi:hypothetical protein
MGTLDEIRAKLLAQNTKADGNGQRNGGDNSVFPFWNAAEGSTTQIRYLPDGDTTNTFFWVEKLVIKMPFQGVKGEHDREVIVPVPCMEMYGETCPVLAETRPWWKDDSLQAMARKYWKKKSYIFQGFVTNSSLEEKEVPENLIRRFVINPSIFEIIKGSLMDPEMEDLPTDFIAGRDFNLKKTTKGGYANYSTSNWSMKTRGLSPVEQAAIDEHGLFDLKEFLPKKPTPEALEAIKEMFQASVNDEAFDTARWGQFFRANGSYAEANKTPSTSTSSGDSDTDNVAESCVSTAAADAMSRLAAKTPSVPTPSAPVAVEGKTDVSEILRRIKERQNQ